MSAFPPKYRGRILLGLGLGLALYVAILLWADAGRIATALADFPPLLLLAAMGLSFANYLVRFPRWERYRALLGIEMSRGTSFAIYLAGLALTVTPGKMGEAYKSVLVRRVAGTPIHRSAPMVVAERYTDLCGFLVLVAVGGIASEPDYQWIFWATLGLCALLLALAGSRRFARLAVAAVARIPLLARLAPRLEGAFESGRALLAPRELPFAVLLAAAGWSLECLGFWLIANALAPAGIPLLFATFAFSLAAIAGAVLVIFPGGLGVTEASMGGLLVRELTAGGLAAELAQASAAAAVILTRLATLWFAVAVGLIAALVFARRRAR